MIELTEDQQAQQLARDYKETFGTPGGKRVLDHMKILTKFNIAAVPNDFTGRIDSYEVMRQEGMRSVIIHVEMMLRKKPDETKGIQNER